MEQYIMCIKLLENRNVTIDDIANIVYFLQKDHCQNLDLSDCISSVKRVLNKREVQHAIFVAVELDKLAENNQMENKLLEDISEATTLPAKALSKTYLAIKPWSHPTSAKTFPPLIWDAIIFKRLVITLSILLIF